MGMDIYFQPFSASGAKIGDRVELRGREIYHLMNDWREAQEEATPESGEHVKLSEAAWAQLRAPIGQAIGALDREIASATHSRFDEAESAENVAAWLSQIWPEGTAYTEYWFTV